MVNRKRPRLNITLPAELKSKIKNVADELDLPLSRLLEFIIKDFHDKYEKKNFLPEQLEEKLRKYQKGQSSIKKEKQIEDILRKFNNN